MESGDLMPAPAPHRDVTRSTETESDPILLLEWIARSANVTPEAVFQTRLRTIEARSSSHGPDPELERLRARIVERLRATSATTRSPRATTTTRPAPDSPEALAERYLRSVR